MRNLTTATLAVNTLTYTDVSVFGEITDSFTILPHSTDLLVSVGHPVPADGTSVTVLAGNEFDIDAPTGLISIKAVGANSTISLIAA